MKTLQEQYNQIKKGKGSKHIFLKEVKAKYPKLEVVVGNIATAAAAKYLVETRIIVFPKAASSGIVNANGELLVGPLTMPWPPPKFNSSSASNAQFWLKSIHTLVSRG